MLDVTGLDAGYGEIQILRGLSLTVEPGECVCLVGANGAGKTTLMRSLSGLLRPVGGSIRFDGQELARLSAHDVVTRGVALVPEGRRVFGPLTVRDNLEMGAFRHLWPRRNDGFGRDLDFVLTLFPRLRERLQQPAGTLSGGEQQMLAIGRALMTRPKLLLLDEPSMGLAPLVVKEIFATIRALNAEGMAILLAEQNARMALRTASRGYVIAEGRIVNSADTAALQRDPAVQEAYLGF
ncbi:branched-chain amino acid transport system ATP-binding protein [Azospirillum rugosum]|uniref:Branched-chain amino acid transport system ATP-binding protein n=1 Tax=Azospirillum rugosum TaxID=416170 RepID=A0ABS4SK30_9PROT|nr:ABC transporter ATP-binding protein [Azospirillum rugosum]MBP2292906.1 branched-chain amino acid transport system ATP-binding protein [Azospirillum rugosum]MDQ0529342.1 branched-chain amino acid transport system ATP-binding protein [Azospirillum rugosum]